MIALIDLEEFEKRKKKLSQYKNDEAYQAAYNPQKYKNASTSSNTSKSLSSDKYTTSNTFKTTSSTTTVEQPKLSSISSERTYYTGRTTPRGNKIKTSDDRYEMSTKEIQNKIIELTGKQQALQYDDSITSEEKQPQIKTIQAEIKNLQDRYNEKNPDYIASAGNSIVLNTLGAVPTIIDTTKQAASNFVSKVTDDTYYSDVKRLKQLESELAGLELLNDNKDIEERQALRTQIGELQNKISNRKAELDKPVSQDTAGSRLMNMAAEEANKATQDIENPYLKGVADFGLQLANTMIPSALLAPLGAGAVRAGTGVLSAGQSMADANRQNISAGKSLARGSLVGGIEYATSKAPTELLFKTINNKPIKNSLANLARNIFVNGGTEGIEEAGNTILNHGVDAALGITDQPLSASDVFYSGLAGMAGGAIFGAGAMGGKQNN